MSLTRANLCCLSFTSYTTCRLTITSKILFKDAIHGIKDFLNNNADCYPLILSLEIHCSLLYQDAMAESLISILGESLYIPDEASLYDPLPSPEE